MHKHAVLSIESVHLFVGTFHFASEPEHSTMAKVPSLENRTELGRYLQLLLANCENDGTCPPACAPAQLDSPHHH